MICNSFNRILLVAVLPVMLADSLAWAQDASSTPAAPCGVKVENAWVRATVPGQKGTGAFMRLTAGQACQLVAAASPIAGVTQVHRMVMEDGVMRMRAVEDGLPLPAGQSVELAPGGLHVMLMDLKQPVAAGASVPITLTVQDSQSGASGQVAIDAPVRALGADAAGAPHGSMAH